MPSALLKLNVTDSNILPRYIQRHRVKRSMHAQPLWSMLSDTQQAGQGIALWPKKGWIYFAICNFFSYGEVFPFIFFLLFFFFLLAHFGSMLCVFKHIFQQEILNSVNS